MAPLQRNPTSKNPNGLPMRLAATYSRDISASPARIWENVRDWEHLPWLHAESFSSCKIEEAADWGWRAVTYGAGAAAAQRSVVELVIDLPRSRYVSRTLDGPLPGVEIWTALTPIEPHRTRVDVEFHLPHLSGAQAGKAGASLVSLYTRLWDEDEAMMIDRQASLDAGRHVPPPAPVQLGDLNALRASLPVTVEAGGIRVRIVDHGGALRAYPARCPHLLAPLDRTVPDAQGCITCPWHGYRFDITSGLSADGRGLTLGPIPAIDIDSSDRVSLVWR